MTAGPPPVHRYTVSVDLEPADDGWDVEGNIVTSYIARTPLDALTEAQRLIRYPENISEVQIRRHD